MLQPLRSKLLIAAGLALIIVGGAAWFAYRNAAQASESASGADRVSQVTAASDALLASLSEARAARCGYLPKREPAQRGRCDAALAALPGRMDDLRRLVADDEDQVRRVDAVGEEVARMRDFLRTSLEMRDEPGRRLNDKGQAALTAELAKEETQVRGGLAELKAAEGARLARSEADGRAAAGRVMTAVDVGNVLTLLAAALAALVLRRDFVACGRSDRVAREARLRAERPAAEADAAFQAQAARQEHMSAQCRRLEQLGAVGRLTGGVAHDFNNLLMVAMGGCEATLRKLPAEAASREPLDAALKACEKAAALSRRVLALTRNHPARPAQLDLNAVVGDMGRMLRRLAGEDVVLELDLDPSARPVLADPVLVEQVLLNLVVNARDASAPGGWVCVSTCDIGDGAELTVTDDGCGMDEVTKARMFEPFFTTKGEGKGTGLGLAVVLDAVRECGGRIDVESAPRRGTSIRVWLPAACRPATVLLVDPGEKAAPFVLETMRRLGHSVLRARDGEEALRTAEGHAGPIHLLVTDMAPPGMCGPELAARLAVTRPGLKVLFLAGEGFAPRVRTDPGVTGPAVLPHPYTLEVVGLALSAALADPAGGREP